MSRITTNPLLWFPNDGSVLSCVIDGGWGASAWVELVPYIPPGTVLAAIAVVESVSLTACEFEFGVGSAGAETAIGSWRACYQPAALPGPNITYLPVPWNVSAWATGRAVVRARAGLSIPSTIGVRLGAYLPLDATTQTGAPPLAIPSLATVTLIPHAVTPWVNGAWVECSAGLATAAALAALVPETGVLGATGYADEVDFGIGAAGAETVLTTFRYSSYAQINPQSHLPLPAFRSLPHSMRLAARLRSSSTTQTTRSVGFVAYGSQDTVPPTPVLTATALDYATVQLTWEDVEGETAYELEWGTDGVTYVPLVTLPADTVSYDHEGRAQLTHYYYRLRAVNAVGPSEWSLDDVTTPIAPEFEPDSDIDRSGETIGYVWEEIRNADDDLECYSDIGRAINDDADWYGGRKAPKVERWGPIERALSDYRGLYEGAIFSAIHTDGDWSFRIRHADHLYAAASVVWRTISEAARRARLLARTLVRGIVSQVRPLAERKFEIVCADVLSRHFGVAADERQIPRRTLSRTHFVTLPTDQVGKPEPIVYGALSDEGSATAPPILTGDPADGAFFDEGTWTCGCAPIAGCAADPPTGLTAAAVAGGALSTDVPNAEYGLWATSVDAMGVESDPVPFTITHANGGARSAFDAGTPHDTVSAGVQQIDADWTVGAGAVATRVYLGIYYYGWRPLQRFEVAAPGTTCSFDAGPPFGEPCTPDNITSGATVITDGYLGYYRVAANMADGQTGLSQECAAIVVGYRRPTRVRWVAVAGVISYSIFRRPPGYDFDRQWTVLAGTEVLDDDWLDGSATMISGAPSPTGQVPATYVGTEEIDGGIWHRWMIAGHACKRILGIFHGGVRVNDGLFGVTWLAPDFAGWPFGTVYRDINGRRYTLIYVRGPDAEATITGTHPITLNVEGRETVGDGSGDLITSIPLQERDFLQNFGFGDWQTGASLASPAFPPDPAPEDTDTVRQIDDASFNLVVQVLEPRGPGAGIGAGMFGANGTFVTLREALARFHVSGGYNCAINRRTQFMVSAFDDRLEALDNTVLFEEAREIDEGSVSIETVDAEHFNARPYAHTYDYARGAWKATGELPNAESISRYGVTRRGPEMALWFIRSAILAEDVVTRENARTADPPTRVRFATPAVGFNTELGDLVRVTHSDGIGPTGWLQRPVRVLRHVADPATLGTAFVAEDVGDRMEEGT